MSVVKVNIGVTVEPVAGMDIVSTIDERIQFIAERELERAVVYVYPLVQEARTA